MQSVIFVYLGESYGQNVVILNHLLHLETESAVPIFIIEYEKED